MPCRSRVTADSTSARTIRLVTMAGGDPVLDADGSPIAVNRDLPLSIDASGRISQDGKVIADLGVVTVDDLSTLSKQGTGLYHSTEFDLPAGF